MVEFVIFVLVSSSLRRLGLLMLDVSPPVPVIHVIDVSD